MRRNIPFGLGTRRVIALTSLAVLAALFPAPPVVAQPTGPSMRNPKLDVRPIVEGLVTPTTLAFIGPDDFFVLEKNSGRVLRVTNGVVQGAVLDLAVNAASERGLLGIALHPDFPTNPGVYLFWTCRTAGSPADPFVPDETTCADEPELGEDTDNALAVPLLANRVDRFVWNGSSLTFDRNLIRLRAFQNDAAPTPPNQGDEDQPVRANHNGGILRFGPDGKLYVLFGDQGRRGVLQNLILGPTATSPVIPVPDDQFGGPAPDPAHLSGVILRLNDDGTAPPDNPFHDAGTVIGGEIGANLQKIYAYGIRNSFGMAFDPSSGQLWLEENGEDAFDELNRVEPGMNGGWIQFAGPSSRIAQFREIETTSLHGETFPNLQQLRWGPERIAETEAEGLARLVMIPGAHYEDPEISFKYVLAPAGIGFAGKALGGQFAGDLFMGFATPAPLGGALFHFKLAGNGKHVATTDPRLADGVVDNLEPLDLTETESLVIGQDFGIVTDIETAPNGNLYVVSLSNGAVYEVFQRAKGGGHGTGASLAVRSGQTIVAANRSTGARVTFELATAGALSADVYDLQGRVVRRIAQDQEFAEGPNTVVWDGRTDRGALAQRGIYFVRLQKGEEKAATRVLWMP